MNDKLWVPLLTHYRVDRPGAVDPDRTLAHLAAIRHSVGQIMLAGSTGDGWDLDDAGFDALIDLAASKPFEDLDVAVLFGVLRPTTEAVVQRLKHLEARLATLPELAARCQGVAICPPVDEAATQETILAHYEAVIAASESPVAVYQLPQVTGCEIAPETFATMADWPRVTMFKDSSGADTVADSGLGFGNVEMVRGAEGGYLEALKPEGPYDGWLLSTGNAVAARLRDILKQDEDARTISNKLGAVISTVFENAQNEGGANAFSNANRALDHLKAFGSAWRDHPLPRKIDGNQLSRELVEAVQREASQQLMVDSRGYLQS